MNTAARGKGWSPPWSAATPVFEGTMQPGTKVNMIVDKTAADAINDAMAKGNFSDVKLGGWGTFDEVGSIAVDMRQKAAITNQFKSTGNGPFYVVELEVQRPLNANVGFAGSQRDIGTALRGGATQAEFLIPAGEKRIDYLRPVSTPKKRSGE